MDEQQLKLPYRKKTFITLSMLLFAIFLFFALFIIDFDGNKEKYTIFVLSIIILLFGCFSQLIQWVKEYHILVDKKERKLFIDNGIRKSSEFDLDDVLGVAYDTVTVNSVTTYMIQLKVTPDVWGTYYRKKISDIKEIEKDYQYMFIYIKIANQKDEDIQQLMVYLHECGLKLDKFQKTTLGKTHGIMKKNSIDTQSKEYKKLMYKQLFSYFLKWIFVLFLIFYFAFQLLGKFNGIYW